jgi:hypothetical protein
MKEGVACKTWTGHICNVTSRWKCPS